MPGDARLVLLDRITLDSGSDGVGSGTDPTAGSGAVLSVPEETKLAATLFLTMSDTGGEPGDADTLDVIVECSPDGGTNWDPVGTFRTFLGIELPDDAADKTVRKALYFRTPRADAGQDNEVKVRLNITASDASNWGVYSDIRAEQDVRSEWLKDSEVA